MSARLHGASQPRLDPAWVEACAASSANERAPRAAWGPLGLALCALVAFSACATEFPGEDATLDEFEYPVGSALHPGGRYLYVVNSNFDMRFRPQEGGTLVVVDLETRSIIESATRTLGSFASSVVLNEDGTKGYIAVRGDATITWFTIEADGRSVRCPLSDGKSLTACRFGVPAEPTGLAYARGHRDYPIIEADGTARLDDQGRPVLISQDFDILAIAHLEDGLVSIATVADPPAADKAPATSVASAALVDGPSEVVRYEGERFFVTGRAASSVVGFRPAIGTDGRVLGISADTILPVPTPFSSYKGRALLFDEAGDRLYLTNQSPSSLVVFDMSAGDNDAVSGRRNRVIGAIDLPRGPNRMTWIPRPDGGAPLLYLTSSSEDSVTVVDVDLLAVVADVDVGDSPFDIVYNASRREAYVTNFGNDTLSVLDVDDPLAPAEAAIVGEPVDR